MDKIILFIFCGLLLFGLTMESKATIESSSEDRQLNADVPDEVTITFDQRYKGAQQIVWEDRDNQYKATFEYKGKKMFAFFNESGTWMKSFTKVTPQDLPVSVLLYIQEHLDGYELNRHYLRSDTEIESYAVAVKKGADYVWMQFDLDGKFISSQV